MVLEDGHLFDQRVCQSGATPGGRQAIKVADADHLCRTVGMDSNAAAAARFAETHLLWCELSGLRPCPANAQLRVQVFDIANAPGEKGNPSRNVGDVPLNHALVWSGKSQQALGNHTRREFDQCTAAYDASGNAFADDRRRKSTSRGARQHRKRPHDNVEASANTPRSWARQ